MDRDTFWKMMDEAKANADGDAYAQAEVLEANLSKCSAEDICAFEKHFSELYVASYGWPLWGAAYLINGGCSDDGFDYFRGWLIAQGQDVFEKAMADPDSLAGLEGLEQDEADCEDMLYVAGGAYKTVAGEDMPVDPRSYPELGEDWDFDSDSEMRQRYPKLFAKFCAG